MTKLQERKAKAELNAKAINMDFFGYASECVWLPKGKKYKVQVDGILTYYSTKQMAEEWDSMDEDERNAILEEINNA